MTTYTPAKKIMNIVVCCMRVLGFLNDPENIQGTLLGVLSRLEANL
jgi:hypothetical protein